MRRDNYRVSVTTHTIAPPPMRDAQRSTSLASPWLILNLSPGVEVTILSLHQLLYVSALLARSQLKGHLETKF